MARMQNDTQLREFENWSDLATDEKVSQEDIVRWVNSWARHVIDQREYHKRYQKRKQLILKAAEKMLDPDELEELEKQAAQEGA